jgi:hypothetical protein
MPDDADVESTPTELFVAARPVEAEVESAVALLFVDDRPVDSEPTPL